MDQHDHPWGMANWLFNKGWAFNTGLINWKENSHKVKYPSPNKLTSTLLCKIDLKTVINVVMFAFSAPSCSEISYSKINETFLDFFRFTIYIEF